VKIDIDEFPEMANEYTVRSVPTFLFLSGKKTVSEVRSLVINLSLLDKLISRVEFHSMVISKSKILQFTGAAEPLLVEGIKNLELSA
jgi:thioredoxin-like negative regulator of GroEL